MGVEAKKQREFHRLFVLLYPWWLGPGAWAWGRGWPAGLLLSSWAIPICPAPLHPCFITHCLRHFFLRLLLYDPWSRHLCLSLSPPSPPVSISVFFSASLLLASLPQFRCPSRLCSRLLHLSHVATLSAFPIDIHSVIPGAWEPQPHPSWTRTGTFTVLR